MERPRHPADRARRRGGQSGPTTSTCWCWASGIAGGCATVSAAAARARCWCWKTPPLAGGSSTTAMAAALLPRRGTAVQIATGHPDSAEEMYSYLVAVSRDPEHDPGLLRGSVEHFDWLGGLGFGSSAPSARQGHGAARPEGLSYPATKGLAVLRVAAKPSPGTFGPGSQRARQGQRW